MIIHHAVSSWCECERIYLISLMTTMAGLQKKDTADSQLVCGVGFYLSFVPELKFF